MESTDPSEPAAAAVTPLPQHDEPGRHQVSAQSRAISMALRLGLHPVLHRLPSHAVGIRTARTAVDAASRLVRHHPRAKVERLVDPQAEMGRSGRPVTGEWVTPVDGATRGEGAVLYLHGGAYVLCSPRTHRPITSRLAVDTGLPVFVPHYRLAPEHPFPAALEDALDAYNWLLRRGIPAERIVIAGDSSGGHLAASLTGELCRTGGPVPAGVVLFSPWVDLTCELSTQADVRDAYISAHAAQRIGRVVVGKADLDDPRLALLACSWTGTPPFLIQVGDEVLRPEAERLAQALADAGARCELQVWQQQMHVFQLLNRVLPEARAAMREAARFIDTVIAPATKTAAA